MVADGDHRRIGAQSPCAPGQGRHQRMGDKEQVGTTITYLNEDMQNSVRVQARKFWTNTAVPVPPLDNETTEPRSMRLM